MLVNDKVASATFSISNTVGSTLNFNQTDENGLFCAVLCWCYAVIVLRFSL